VHSRRLVASGLEVPAIGLGCMGMSQSYGPPPGDRHEMIARGIPAGRRDRGVARRPAVTRAARGSPSGTLSRRRGGLAVNAQKETVARPAGRARAVHGRRGRSSYARAPELTLAQRQAVTRARAQAYARAGRAKKGRILDELVELTGRHRTGRGRRYGTR
jgi:hypothetical protein